MFSNMKILHLISAGAEWEPAVRVVALAAALREFGLDSAVTAPDHSRLWEVAEAAGVEVIDYALESSINPLRWMDFSKTLKAISPGIIHAHDAEAARLLSRAQIFSGEAVIATSRYDLRTQPAAAEYGASIDAVICPSEALAEVFRNHKEAAAKVRVVHDGVSIASADRALEEREGIRHRYRDACCPHKEKPLYIISIAPLEEASGFADLLEAFPEILAVLPQCHLFIMGEGPLRLDLERQVKITALERDVTFLEPDKAFIRLLAAGDAYISCRNNDVSGFMVQAAMAAGRASVLSKSGCYDELVEDGKSGVFTAEDGPAGIKTALLDLLENRSRREHLGRLAKARAEKMFDIANQAGRTAEIYGEIASAMKQ